MDDTTAAMTVGPKRPARIIAALSAPLVGFFLIQNLVSLATLAMVGRLGDAPLAGVGVGNALYALLLALLYGLDTGVQAVVSRTTGAEARERMGATLANGLSIAAPLGGALMLAAWFVGPHLLRAMGVDPAVSAAGTAFLAGAAPSLLLLSVTIPFNAYWIGSGQPGVAFGVTVLTAPCQVLFSLGLIVGARLGPVGAGLAITLATAVGFAAQMVIATRLRPIPGLFRRRPDRPGMAGIVRIGWPVSAQQSLVQACLMAAFAIVARLGVAEVAVVNVLASLMLLPIQTATGMGTAAATLVGQSLGRGEPGEARRWGWRAGAYGALAVAPLGCAVLAAPSLVLGLFIADPATVALAVWPARLLALSIGLEAFGRILGFSLRGAGATKAATAIPFVTQCLAVLPAIWLVGVRLGYGLRGVVSVQVAIIVIEATAYAWIWNRGRWDGVRIAGLDRPAVVVPNASP